jgi:hypothetical protein
VIVAVDGIIMGSVEGRFWWVLIVGWRDLLIIKNLSGGFVPLKMFCLFVATLITHIKY